MMIKRWRYRLSQTLLLALLSALAVGCAVFGPLYERALEQSILLEALARAPSGGTSLVLASTRSGAPLGVAGHRAFVPPTLTDVYAAPEHLWSGRLAVATATGRTTTTLWARDDTCAGLTIVAGQCPSAAGELLVSSAEAQVQGWVVGTIVGAIEDRPGGTGRDFPWPLRVAGVFELPAGQTTWGTSASSVGLTGRAGRRQGGEDGPRLMDGIVVHERTFTEGQSSSDNLTSAGGWARPSVTTTFTLRAGGLTLDRLGDVQAAMATLIDQGVTQTPRIRVTSSVGEVAAEVNAGRAQAQVIVPLLVLQLALLSVLVLGLVAASAVEQRRPEAGLARLRGAGPAQATRRLLAELGAAVTLGAPFGALGAWALTAAARAWWLPAGVPAEWPVLATLAGLAIFALAWVVIAVPARSTERETVAELLRRVPPRRGSGRIAVQDAVVAGVCLAAVVALGTGNLTGPLALLSPVLLALTVGLALAHLLPPTATWWARRALATGRVTAALAAVQIARRPAVRHLITIVTVATALSVFAADAYAVAGRNRDVRARLESGAAAVVRVNASSIAAVRSVVAQADPNGSSASVVTWTSGGLGAPTTMGVVPGQFERVADLTTSPEAFDLAPLAFELPPAPVIVGSKLSVEVENGLRLVPDVDYGQPHPEGENNPTGEVTLELRVRIIGGPERTVTLGGLIPGAGGSLSLSADIECPSGCEILSLGVGRRLGDIRFIEGAAVIRAVRGDQGAAAQLGPADAWVGKGDPQSERDEFISTAVGGAGTLTLNVRSLLQNLSVTSKRSGAPLPALLVGTPPAGYRVDEPFPITGLDGLAVQVHSARALPYAPGGPAQTAVVNVDVLAHRAPTLDPATRVEIFVANPDLLPNFRKTLTDNDIQIVQERRMVDSRAVYDNSASAWGLRLALLVGALAIAMAALVMILLTATAWRGRARDLAALEFAGVAKASLRVASAAEHAIVAGISVAVGAGCGVAAAALALPMVPMFSRPSAVFTPDLSHAPAPMIAAAGVALGTLVTVAGTVGAALVRRAQAERLRDQL